MNLLDEFIENSNAEAEDCAFPNDASSLRNLLSILIDLNDEWITGNRGSSVKSETISSDSG